MYTANVHSSCCLIKQPLKPSCSNSLHHLLPPYFRISSPQVHCLQHLHVPSGLSKARGALQEQHPCACRAWVRFARTRPGLQCSRQRLQRHYKAFVERHLPIRTFAKSTHQRQKQQSITTAPFSSITSQHRQEQAGLPGLQMPLLQRATSESASRGSAPSKDPAVHEGLTISSW